MTISESPVSVSMISDFPKVMTLAVAVAVIVKLLSESIELIILKYASRTPKHQELFCKENPPPWTSEGGDPFGR
jgi:hypothetical protein